MSAPEMTELRRISFSLDAGLVLERLILNRLSGLRRKRGHDWLRSLLVQGFLAEGQWLRINSRRSGEGAAPQASGLPTTAFASWLEGSDRLPRRAPSQTAPSMPDDTGRAEEAASRQKPFASLRNVIG